MKKRKSTLSILYIEKDLKLQDEVSSHLKKIFSNVIQANDANEGLSQYKKNKPDIVLTDLDFTNINSFEMVVEMQDFNSEASIMVLSNRNDDFDLLETLDLGLEALIEKPLNFTILNKIFQSIILKKTKKSQTTKNKPLESSNITEAIKETTIKTKEKSIKKTISTSSEQIIVPKLKEKKVKPKVIQEEEKIVQEKVVDIPRVDYSKCDKIILDAVNNQSDVLCINSYKGLIISNNSKIVEFKNGLFMLQVTKTQLFSIIHEKKVTLKIAEKYILAKLFRINKEKAQIILKEPVLLDFKPRDKTNKRLNVDSSFKITMGFNNSHKELKAIDVSSNHVILESEVPLDIKNNATVELTMGFEIDAPSSMILDKKFTKVFAKGIIQRVDQINNKQRIIIEHKIQASGINVYKQYLQQREINIITEFKTKMKNKL